MGLSGVLYWGHISTGIGALAKHVGTDLTVFLIMLFALICALLTCLDTRFWVITAVTGIASQKAGVHHPDVGYISTEAKTLGHLFALSGALVGVLVGAPLTRFSNLSKSSEVAVSERITGLHGTASPHVSSGSNRSPPPSISKEGVRWLWKRLTDETNIDTTDDYEYPTLHGAHRVLGRDLYTNSMSEKAQEALRHKSIETTHESYTDLRMKDVLDSIDEVRE